MNMYICYILYSFIIGSSVCDEQVCSLRECASHINGGGYRTLAIDRPHCNGFRTITWIGTGSLLVGVVSHKAVRLTIIGGNLLRPEKDSCTASLTLAE
jgi:hypothetical protein